MPVPDEAQQAIERVGIGRNALRRQRIQLRQHLEIVEGDGRTGKVAECFLLAAIIQQIGERIAEAGEVNGLLKHFIHDSPVLVEQVEVDVQRFGMASLPKVLPGTRAGFGELLAGPDRRGDHEAISSSSAGSGTGMRSISRGSNFVRPPAYTRPPSVDAERRRYATRAASTPSASSPRG